MDMKTRKANGKPEPEPRYCPHCKRVLKTGRALLRSGVVAGMAYICPPCRVVYLVDLKPLARLSRGVN